MYIYNKYSICDVISVCDVIKSNNYEQVSVRQSTIPAPLKPFFMISALDLRWSNRLMSTALPMASQRSISGQLEPSLRRDRAVG